MERAIKAALVVTAVLVVAVGAFFGGIMFEATTRTAAVMADTSLSATQSGALDSTMTTLLRRATDVIQRKALVPVSDTSMTIGAMDGLLASLNDKYAAYFDPRANGEFQMDTSGEFFGVGMTVGAEDATSAAGKRITVPQVGTVFKGTPAQRAGMQAEDVITAVDGMSTTGQSIDQVVERIRGPRGTKVTVTVTRVGSKRPLRITMTRDKISIPNIESSMQGKDVGYIRLMEFNAKAADDVAAALASLAKKGAKGYVLDLRENPGGLLSSAVDLVSLFVPQGVVVRVDERGKPEEQSMATGNVVTKLPLVVLIDKNSASASEIAAVALQDYRRATIVGETSYGKGSVQTVEQLPNGGAIKFTIAHYLSPKKRVINGKGVVPDVAVTMDIHLQSKRATDTQLQRALQLLRAKF